MFRIKQAAGPQVRPLTARPVLTAGVFWLAIGFAWTPAVGAQQEPPAPVPKNVTGGSTAIILESEQPITDPGATIGKTVVTESSKTPRTYILEYAAPVVTAATDATVTYTLKGEEKSARLRVNPAPPTLTSPGIYEQSFKALFVLFIVAVILESGLAVIFNWRPYIQLFDSRGMKTIVAFAFSYFFVHVFKLDITTTLVNLYSGNGFAVSGPGKFVTALVIAGGSSGVNNLFLALGFRSVKRTQQVTPKPRRTEGWVAVRLIRDAAIGPVMVLVSEVGGNSTIAGTITGTSKPPGFLRYFLRDPGRFPTAGGHSLDVNKQYEIQLTGEDNSGQPVTSSKWGPYQFSAGAIVDIDLTL